MTCDELRPDYELYALGVLEDPERGEIRAHLARGCENCRAGLWEAHSLVYAIAASVEGPEPSRGLRKRVLAVAGGVEEKRSAWFGVFAFATAAAVVVAGLAVGYAMRQESAGRVEVARLQRELERGSVQAAAMREAIELIQSPETREVNFGEGKPARPQPPRGRVFFQPSGVLLMASQLPAPPSGKTYEMWIIRGGKAAPAGLFGSDTQGNALHLFRPGTPLMAKDIVAVTLETAAGVMQPTTTPIIVAPL